MALKTKRVSVGDKSQTIELVKESRGVYLVRDKDTKDVFERVRGNERKARKVFNNSASAIKRGMQAERDEERQRGGLFGTGESLNPSLPGMGVDSGSDGDNDGFDLFW